MPSAADKRRNRFAIGRRQQPAEASELVLGEIPAKRIAFVHLAFGQGVGDLVFHHQELLVPVGLEFVDVEAWNCD